MYKVVFVTSTSYQVQRNPGTIEISPSRDSWNDFGYRVRVDVVVYPQDEWKRPLYLPGFLGFIAKDERHPDVRLLERLLAEAGGELLIPEISLKFFTMLPDLGSYRKIVLELGSEQAIMALRAMNDVVASESESGNAWLRTVKDLPHFQRAFLRTAESYFAWKNAGSILQGLGFEEVGQISQSLKIRFSLAGRPNEHELTFRFSVREDLLPKRFAIVIGKNGVGKSQALGRIARAALRGDPVLTDCEGDRPSLNRILAFTPTSANSSVFPTNRHRRPRVWYRRFSINSPGFGRQKQTTSDLVLQLARTDEHIAGSSRLELFLDALSVIDNWEELALRTRSSRQKVVQFNELQSGSEEAILERFMSIDLRVEPVRFLDGNFYDLSSGELSFLRFAAIASLYIENGTLILLDEPETHLHPNFISQFVAVLDRLLEKTGSAAIIATHSVYFVREAFEDQVIVLRSDANRRIVPEVPALKTFGADVGAISYFVFGEDEPSRLARYVERKITESSSSWSEVLEKYRDELSLELLGEIRALIEDGQAAESKE